MQVELGDGHHVQTVPMKARSGALGPQELQSRMAVGC